MQTKTTITTTIISDTENQGNDDVDWKLIVTNLHKGKIL